MHSERHGRAPAGPAGVGPGLRLVVLSLSAALVGGLLIAPAGAQDIDALRQRAEQLADELKGLERQASIADEDYLVVLDRIDSLVFTAPLFLHFIRYFYD